MEDYKGAIVKHCGKDYTVVEKTLDYIKTIFNMGDGAVEAMKTGKVIARQSKINEPIVIYTHDEGSKFAVSGLANHYVLTKADADGKPMLDEFKHVHRWQISEEVLRRRYVIPEEGINGSVALEPTGERGWFMRIDRNIVIKVPWGEHGRIVDQYLCKGSYISISKENDLYGIPRQDFLDTYKVFYPVDRHDLATTIGCYMLKRA